MELVQPYNDDDTGYLKLDQTTPQTVINGTPIFNVGLNSNAIINVNLNTVTGPATLTGTGVRVQGADNGTARIAISSFGVAGMNAFAARHARGTAASPSAVQSGDVLYSTEGWGYGATNYSSTPKVFTRGYAAETWTDAAQGTYWSIWTTPLLGTTTAERLRIDSDGKVGINTTSITGRTHFVDTNNLFFYFDAHRSAGGTSGLILRSSRGTQSSPSATKSGDNIGVISFRGYGATAFAGGSRLAITCYADEDWTDAAQGTRLSIRTCPNGSVSTTEKLLIGSANNVKYLTAQIWYPTADGTSAFQYNKADGTTNVLNIDTTNGRLTLTAVNTASTDGGNINLVGDSVWGASDDNAQFRLQGKTDTTRKMYMGVNTTGNVFGYIQVTETNVNTRPLYLNPAGGNVAIGAQSSTLSAPYRLTLGNTSATTIGIVASLTDVVGRSLTIQSGNTVAGTAVDNVVGGDININSGLGTGTGESNIIFSTGRTLTTGKTLQTLTEAGRFIGTGALLIGGQTTTSTGYKLDVITQQRFRSSATANWASIDFNETATGLQIYTNYNGTVAEQPLSLGTYTGRTNQLYLAINGNIGIGTATPTNILSLGGNSARTIWMERHTTSNTAGNTLTIQSGGATSSATDKDGGMMTISPGLSTGTGKNSIRLQRLARASSTGTTDNALSDAFIVPSEFNLTNSSANSLFEIALPTTALSGGTIDFSIIASDGTDMQVYKGLVQFSAVNKAGVYTTNINELSTSQAMSAGTLTTTWAVTSGTNKITIQVTPVSSLTNTTYKIRYTLNNMSGSNAVTQL